MFSSLNNFVAVKPLGALSIETAQKSGFAVVKQKTTLTSSEVVFAPQWDPIKGGVQLHPGDVVYFRADEMHEYARQIYSVETENTGTQFILLPIDRLKLVQQKAVGLPFGLDLK